MTTRRFLFNLHLYAGLLVGVLLVFSGLSGSLLVFREEIEAVAYPGLLVTEAQGDRVTVDAVLQTVRRAYPNERAFGIRMPRTPHQTYLVKLNGAHDLFVYVDPYSGKILGARQQTDLVTGWISLLHTQLLSGDAGEIALGIGALVLIGLCLTGLVLWWPGNGKISQGFKVRWSARWKRLNFDLHRASGIYAALFLLITAFTGVALVFNKSVSGLIDAVTQSPARAAPPQSGPPRPGMPPPSLDVLLRQADRVLPASTTWISLPQTAQAPLVLRKKLSQESHPNGKNFVYFDRYTGQVLHVENSLKAALGTRIFTALYPIHIGTIGGPPTRILQVAVGLAPMVLFVTGFVMWKNRTRTK